MGVPPPGKNISVLKCAFQSVGSGFHLRHKSSLFGSLRFAVGIDNSHSLKFDLSKHR